VFLWRNDGELWITYQTDHMTQVGDIGRAWGNDEFLPARRPGAAIAGQFHDEGWAYIDSAPEFDEETGLPVEFKGYFGSVFGSLSMPAAEYGRGVELLLKIDKYAALIGSLHGTGVYLKDYGIEGTPVPELSTFQPRVQTFLAEEESAQKRLRKETAASDEEVWHDFRLFIAWNRLSQIFSRGLQDAWLSKLPTKSAPEGLKITTKRIDTYTVALDPYPFRIEPLYFPVKTYRLADRPYASTDDFLLTIAKTPPMNALYTAVSARR
jgi:hypothetical protein